MQAVILVGGQGNRMGGVIKPLMEKNGKTMLEYVVDGLKKHGINDFILRVDDKAEQFRKFGYQMAPDFKGVKKLLNDGPFVVTVGDTLTDIDYTQLIRYHNNEPGKITAVSRNYQLPYGLIQGGRFIEKPNLEVAVGIWVMDKSQLPDDFNIPKACDRKFKSFKYEGAYTHLTTKEDYNRWING